MVDGRTVEALCVDAACSGNPGWMEYRGVHIPSGKEIFRFGPVYGTNNIGEFLAIVHGLALLKKKGVNLPVYSDSYTARAWVRAKRCGTTLERNEQTAKLHQIVQRAEKWLQSNSYPNRVETWHTREWGEIPADFGRKNYCKQKNIMSVNDLSYQDYLDRINIQEVLLHAGYTLNRRDGMRYPSFVRIGSDGCRIHGDKFIVTQNGNTCFRPPEQKSYNVISLIKSFPGMFKEHVGSSNPDHLVNEVCRNILNVPSEERQGRIIEPRKEQKPFDLNNYTIHAFRKYDFEGIKKFYPFFITRGISLDTQKAFGAHFILTTKESLDGGKSHTNLSFPLYVPGNTNVVGLEERGYPRLDGSSGYKGKALGSNSSEGLWIAALGKQDLSDATDVYWFESGYDAMSYYQLHVKDNPSLEKAVFVSTGGNPTVGQMQRMLAVTPSARHHICFDNDLAGRQFTENLKGEIHRIALSSVVVTPERKPYLDSIPLSQDFAKGDIDTLPKPLQDKYAKYESAWEESMSMRQSHLCYEGDIREQVDLTRKLYKEYKDSVRDFLGIDSRKVIPFVREVPERGKDWNDQVLLEREDSLKATEEEETRSVASGIDLDADGEIEVNESEEKKRVHFIKR